MRIKMQKIQIQTPFKVIDTAENFSILTQKTKIWYQVEARGTILRPANNTGTFFKACRAAVRIFHIQI